MKKSTKTVIIAGLIAVIIAVIAIPIHRGIFTLYDNIVNGEFSINEEYFQEVINYEIEYSTDERTQVLAELSENIGTIEDAKSARRAAMDIWSQYFSSVDIKSERPFSVYYDPENEIWYVIGTRHRHFVNWRGGSAEMLIDRNGDIISVWHGK